MQGGNEDEPQSPPAEEQADEERIEAREAGRGICGWSMSVLYDKSV
jgi:hypothetical protein